MYAHNSLLSTSALLDMPTVFDILNHRSSHSHIAHVIALNKAYSFFMHYIYMYYYIYGYVYMHSTLLLILPSIFPFASNMLIRATRFNSWIKVVPELLNLSYIFLPRPLFWSTVSVDIVMLMIYEFIFHLSKSNLKID